MKFLSIVIPTYKRNASLKNLLASLCKQEYDPSNLEVIVVGNTLDAELSEMIAGFESTNLDIKLFFTEVVGVNAARNLGISKAKGEILVLFDDDCLLDNSLYLRSVSHLHKTYPNTMVLGGLYELDGRHSLLEQLYHALGTNWVLRSFTESGACFNLLGGNVSYKRQVFDRGFRFNELIRFGGAETDFHVRLVQEGMELRYHPALKLVHRLQLSWGSFMRRAFLQGITNRRIEMEWREQLFSVRHGPTGEFMEMYFAKRPVWQRIWLRWMLSVFDGVFFLGRLRAEASAHDERFAYYLRFLCKRMWSAFLWRTRSSTWLNSLIYSYRIAKERTKSS